MNIRFSTLLLFLLFLANVSAQELLVDSFTEQVSDLSARTEKRNDINDTPCALVKIELPLQGVQFDQRSQVIGKVEYKVNTYWAYLPAGSKHLTLSHPQFHTLDVYFGDYGISSLQSLTTYVLKVTVPASVPIKKQNTQQYVIFHVSPKNAIVEVDGQQLTVTDGMATVRKPFGTYTYTITADRYHAYTGNIIVNDPVNRHEVKVALKSAAGRLSIPTTESAKGGAVYLNNQKVGTVPLSQVVASGIYNVKIVQPMYAAFEQTVTITDDQTTTITPILKPLFGYVEVPEEGNLKGGKVYVNNKEVGTVPYKSEKLAEGNYVIRVVREKYAPVEQTLFVGNGKSAVFRTQLTATFSRVVLTTDKESEIWVNDVKRGVGTWSGELTYGAYLVECKRPNHRPTSKEITISANSKGATIRLESPIPITGTLDVTTTPLDADIYIDGVYKGKTPLLLPDFLIGKHTISLTKDGYTEHKVDIFLAEGDDKQISIALTKFTSQHNGHKYVDLGLPSGLKWATCNVGATKPEEYGNYYAWGETGSKSTLTKYNTSSSKGTVANKTVLELAADAAHVNWGGKWRMPTDAECQELIENCKWTWTDDYNGTGVKGRIVTSKTNGNHIFLPAAGYRNDGDLNGAGSHGHYWSSSRSTDYPKSAWYMYFYSGFVGRYYYDHYVGRSVRPVLSDQAKEEQLRQEQLAQAQREAEEKARQAEQERKAAEAKKQNGTHAGHEYVDLGLSVKWATCNVGATKPEAYGNYYAWGETISKSTYNWSTYKWCNGSKSTLTKYNTDSDYGTVDNKTVLELADDAARANWGGQWRMPTDAEWTELRRKCTWTWTTRNGVKGYTVKSRINGNSIFLPAAGCRSVADLYYVGSNGGYWSSSLNTDYPLNAWNVGFFSGNVGRSYFNRCCGRSVRPVLYMP